MPDHFTTRLALPYPDIDDAADVPADMQQLAERLDLLIPAGSGAGLVLNRATVGDVGMVGQVRAGRQLTAADFTNLGLSAPRGLWNLSDLSDASGNARALTNKGAVTFTNGINGAAATAAQFTGSTAQALYISDTGAADPFRITTGSWGCWFKTAKRGTGGYLLSKVSATGAAATSAFGLSVTNANLVQAYVTDGTTFTQPPGTTDVSDDRWHFAVASFDGTTLRVYVDGLLEAASSIAAAINPNATGPLNIGAYGADGATAAAASHFGRVDEAFVNADVLSDEQVRNLYCARLLHTLAVVPTGAKLNVTRRRRGGAWAVADFPVQPLRLYNFTGSLADQGTNNVALVAGMFGYSVGPDGLAASARYAVGTGVGDTATDAGCPNGTNSRSYGCWLKTNGNASGQGALAFGTPNTGQVQVGNNGGGSLTMSNGADTMIGPFIADGLWHLVIVTEENAPADGIKRKAYFDGRLVANSTVLNAIVLAGAGRFRVGTVADGTLPWAGQIDGVFVLDYVLTGVQVAGLYAKGSQPLAPSPKNAGDHVEAWDAAAIYATFDTLDTNAQVDLGVAA